jgi:hypothetical protein
MAAGTAALESHGAPICREVQEKTPSNGENDAASLMAATTLNQKEGIDVHEMTRLAHERLELARDRRDGATDRALTTNLLH